MSQGQVDLSIVVPLASDTAGMDQYLEKVRSAVEATGYTYEVLLVDGGGGVVPCEALGSTAGRSPNGEGTVRPKAPHWEGALSAAIRKAQGSLLVAFGPGLRDDPRDMRKLLLKLKHYDVAIASRRAGWSSLSNRLISCLHGAPIRERSCGVASPDISTSMKAVRRDAAARLPVLHSMSRIRSNLWQHCGISVVEVPVGRRLSGARRR